MSRRRAGAARQLNEASRNGGRGVNVIWQPEREITSREFPDDLKVSVESGYIIILEYFPGNEREPTRSGEAVQTRERGPLGHVCEHRGCEKDAGWGFARPRQPSHWFCFEPRGEGERYLQSGTDYRSDAPGTRFMFVRLKPNQRSRVASSHITGAKMQGLKRSCWKEAYDLDEFAGRHGLTIRQAEIVIQSNGPSKHKCDLAAAAFKVALEQCRHLRERREAPGYVREPSGDVN